MENNKKQNILGVIFSCAVYIMLASAAGLLIFSLIDPGRQTEAVFSHQEHIVLSPVVKDGISGEPISGASVIFPENDIYLKTDALGHTEKTILPAGKDPRAVILVYAEGYCPCSEILDTSYCSGKLISPGIMLYPDRLSS